MHASAHCQFWGVSTHGCLLGTIQLQQMKLKGFVHLHRTNIQWDLSNTDTLGTKIIVLIKLRHPYFRGRMICICIKLGLVKCADYRGVW